MNEITVSRRAFLQSSGALVIQVGVGAGLATGALDAAAQAASPRIVGPHPSSLDTWIRIAADGIVTVNSGKMDCGQGLDVAYAQIVAEELDVPFESVQVTLGDTRLAPNQGGGSGSTGLRMGANPLRNAAAEARRVLVASAAQQLGVTASSLTVRDGRIFITAEPARGVTYTQLVGGKNFNTQLKWNNAIGNGMNATGEAKPKDRSEYRIVGREFKRRDIADKIIPTEHYTAHIRPAGLLHARAVRPPVAGAQPISVDGASIAAIAGARHFVKGGFIAVVAESEWDAVRAARLLKVQWSDVRPPFTGGDTGVFNYIRQAQPTASNAIPMFGGKKAFDPAPTLAALAQSARVIEADYECAFQSHARIAPSCGVADVRGDKAEIWADTQKPHFLRDGIAKFLGLAPENVQVKWMHGAGSYGRSDADEAPYEAALLSQALGRPVRMQWSREEGTAWDPKAPAGIISMKAGLDKDGKLTGWYFRAKGFNGWDVRFTGESPEHVLVGMLTGHPKWNAYNFNVPEETYQFPNHVHWWETVPPYLQEASPMRTAHLRAPQELQTRFGQECFIDEVALASDVDPVEFRIRHLKEPREIDVIRAAAKAIGWQPRTDSRRERGSVMVGRGIALHSGYQAHAAVAVEVEVHRDTGRIWLRRVVIGHDCGMMVNPAGVRAALEGQIMQGISRSLYEEVSFNEREVTSVDWRTYPIATLDDVPGQVEMVLLNRPDKPIGGAGEPAIVCFPAAIANAVADATGIRIRAYPLTPERVKAALAGAPRTT